MPLYNMYEYQGLPGLGKIPIDYQKSYQQSSSTGPWQYASSAQYTREGEQLNPLSSGGMWSRAGSSQYGENTQQAVNPALVAQMYKQKRWEELFPWIKGLLGHLSNNPFTIGGSTGINTNPIWNPQQIEAKKSGIMSNAMNAAQSQLGQQLQTMGGAGWGATSPMAQALQQSYMSQALGQGQGQATEFDLQAALRNAQHVLTAQTAREQAEIERLRPYFGFTSSLLSGLLGNLT